MPIRMPLGRSARGAFGSGPDEAYWRHVPRIAAPKRRFPPSNQALTMALSSIPPDIASATEDHGQVETSDESLLKLYQNGDAEAFSTLLARYRRPIFGFVLRFTRDAASAEELAQDVFLKVIERSDSFEGNSKFSTWIYKIARNHCIDHKRKMVHRRHASLDQGKREDSQPLREQVAAEQVPVDRQAASVPMRERIREAVSNLPDDQREIFLLRHTKQLKFREIADLVGIPENTVKSRMRYALERLREELSDFDDQTVEERAHRA